MTGKNSNELSQQDREARDVWTRNQEFGGVGEAHDPETVVVEESKGDCFCGFAADEEIDAEKQLNDEHEAMEKGEA